MIICIGMNLSALNEVLKNEPAFRLKQVLRAIYKDRVSAWHEITNLPLSLRDKLAEKCDLNINAASSISKNGITVKALITLNDGNKIESVLMRHKTVAKAERAARNTVCVSSQIGCPLGCAFCATGKLGFKRNLTVDEIVEQVLFFARYLKREKGSGDGAVRVSNIVFMGMGEPMLNYENVLDAIKILHNPNCFNIGMRHISISTAGIIEGIKRLADEKKELFRDSSNACPCPSAANGVKEINLAISFHAPNDNLRKKLMPIAAKYSIGRILDAVDYYIKKTNRRVMFEYIMLRGVNDTDECARKLAKLMARNLYFVNLINYNPTGDFKPSFPDRIARFKEILIKNGVVVTERYRFGTDIDAACGQLVLKNRKIDVR